MKLIKRKYLDDLILMSGTPDIKVIMGIRRSGKSKLMESFINYNIENRPDNNIIHINFALEEFENLREHRKLNEYVEQRYEKDKTNLLLIDEVQRCKGFEEAITSLHATEKYDIYITGSNAFLLSSDLATLFTGRTMSLEIFPFSLAEFREYYNLLPDETHSILNRYIEEGGMAGSYLYSQIEQKHIYVKNVYETLITRDIKEKYRIKNDNLLNQVTDFLMDNIGCEVSPTKIANTLKSHGQKVNDKTISSYISYLCRAFVFYRVRRFDIAGKKYLASNDKYYLCDHSFKSSILGTKNFNRGRLLENIVAVELLRRGYEIYTGVLYNCEIDFVALKRNEKIYIQVSDDISSEETLERELKSLKKIKDSYPKILLASTYQRQYDIEGILVFDIEKWLQSQP